MKNLYYVHEAYDHNLAKKNKYVKLWCKPNTISVYLFEETSTYGQGRIGIVDDKLLYNAVMADTNILASIQDIDKDGCTLKVDFMESNMHVEAIKKPKNNQSQNHSLIGCAIGFFVLIIFIFMVAC
jgi:hypothetical protein